MEGKRQGEGENEPIPLSMVTGLGYRCVKCERLSLLHRQKTNPSYRERYYL